MLDKRASLLAVVITLGTLQVAFAAQTDNAEASALSSVKLNAADAIAAVEANQSGKVVELTLDGNASQPVYRVTTQTSDGTESNFVVDAKSGDVSVGDDSSKENGGTSEHEDGESNDGDNGNNENDGSE
jgi:uncharacterized membrane protein YkoI